MADVPNLHVHELAAAYALDALEADEQLLVEAHLDGCPACAVVVERARRVAALLPFAAEQRSPPPGHEARFLARLGPHGSGARVGSLAAEPRPARPAARRRPIGYLVPLAAAAVLVLGVGAWNLQLQQELANHQQLARLVAQADTRELAPTITSGDARGRAYLDPSTDQVVVAVSRLPELPADQTYQLWFTRPDGRRDSGGTFRPDEGGVGVILTAAPAGLRAYTGVGISAEPAGGSRAPTTPMVLYWGLSR